MSQTYVVVQGDHLARLAQRFGFNSPAPIWNHAENAALKKLRQNPNVLLPGDRVFIPDLEAKEASAASGKMHPFRVTTTKLMLRLTLEDAFFKPFANAPCELVVDGTTNRLVSDSGGRIAQEISPAAISVALIIKDALTPVNDQFIPVHLGHLDPIDSPTGQKARLNNLGYFAGSVDRDDEELFRSAVEEFQCDQLGHGAVDGKCGPKTQARLKEMHGC